jgi:hypothetical protein
LAVEKLPNSELKVTWHKPQEPYGVIQAYYIEWQQVAIGQCKNRSGEGRQVYLTNSTFVYTMQKLMDVDPYRKYRITVFAKTNGRLIGTKAEIQEFTLPGGKIFCHFPVYV